MEITAPERIISTASISILFIFSCNTFHANIVLNTKVNEPIGANSDEGAKP